ncbi:MAG: DUF3109 family protein [Flavobacteriales bacterium]|nr:DUF3109 family protein [Flavobacteriales bacterium]MCB9166917.1 DUF3109 family protein [Flavobacteriales bacterium]
MIQHRGTLLSEDLFEKRFVCDLDACQGACCEQGDSGAPLEPEEAKLIRKHYAKLKPYMTERGKEAVAQQGTSVVDMDEELVTPLVQEYAECAFAKKDERGIWQCGIERAYRDGKIPFNKPISCHLYPIRVKQLKHHEALNYDQWPICKPACSCGAKLDVPVFRFLKDALVRKYGQDWYDELGELYEAWKKRPKKMVR